MTATTGLARAAHSKTTYLIGSGVLIAAVIFMLWEEHDAHILGALPYAILLLCPLMHVFMHGGHHGDGHGGEGRRSGEHSSESGHHDVGTSAAEGTPR